MKKTWVRKTLSVGVLAAGALLFAPAAAAQADVDQVSAGNLGILNGTQVAVPVTVPVNVVGNAVAVAGAAQGRGVGLNKVESGRVGDVDQASLYNRGILNGTQVAVPVTVPVNLTGNGVAVLGKAFGSGASANYVESARAESGCCDNDRGRGRGVGNVDQISAHNFGILNGTQVAAPITVPINACGNAISVIGISQGTGVCSNHVGTSPRRAKVWKLESKHAENGCCGNDRDRGRGVGNVQQLSGRNVGILNGTQIAAPITVPINACGNSLGALLGAAQSFGHCANYVGGDRGDVRFIKGSKKPIYVFDDDVFGDGGVRGDHDHNHGGYPGGVKGDDDGYTKDDDDDVRGDNGYNKGDVRGDKGYGSELPDNAGYGDEAPDNAGYGDEAPDNYGATKKGGRMAEKTPVVSDLTDGLGGVGSTGVGTFDLLNVLR